jgi:hypothetical protein
VGQRKIGSRQAKCQDHAEENGGHPLSVAVARGRALRGHGRTSHLGDTPWLLALFTDRSAEELAALDPHFTRA